MNTAYRLLTRIHFTVPFLLVLLFTANAWGQDKTAARGKLLYDQLRAFALTGGSADVKGLVLKRDRLEMTFDGVFYFSARVEGRFTGAVFIGQGKFSAEVPPLEFEKDNVKRLLGADIVESNFRTAVLRFSDDTFSQIGQNRHDAPVNEEAQRLATDFEPRLLKQTGANLSARIALSILNEENSGFFFATFDGGRRGRFHAVLDYQNRIPVANFDLNAGEKGLVFSYDSPTYTNEIWLAFYAKEDYRRGNVGYSDLNDLIDITHYDMNLDLRDHKKYLRLQVHVQSQARFGNLLAIPFLIGESLSEFESRRLKKQLRLKQANLGGAELLAVQEDWEGGFTVFLPQPAREGQRLDFDLTFEGDFMYDAESVSGCYYPRSNVSWFPRHGYLDRASFALTFRHPKRLHIASVGERLSEEPDAENKDFLVTKYRMEHPVALITFALAIYQRHREMVKWEKGGDPTPLEFNSLPGWELAIKEDFILAELNNSVRYFSLLFGQYPYPTFGAAFHPFSFGQGFPTLFDDSCD